LTDSDSTSGSISDDEATEESSLSDSEGDQEDISGSELDRASLASDSDVDIENKYETARSKRPSDDASKSNAELIKRLPIKLADGSLRPTGLRRLERNEPPSPSSSASSMFEEEIPIVEDVATGARFGRAAVIDVVTTEPRPERIRLAKEQLAGICQDIIADPENSVSFNVSCLGSKRIHSPQLGLLRRLHSFSLPEITSPSRPDPVKIDTVIRKFALLSQLAVFKDIIPGYRIRNLTDKEQAEKVTQEVQRTRDWEQGLLGIYQRFLANADAEVKGKQLPCARSTCRLTASLSS
jgi:nucleolar complex protein 3